MSKKYIDNNELYREIVISKAKGKLTRKAENMFVLLANETIKKKSYRNEDDKMDCMHEGIKALFLNWFNFNEEKYDSPFAYYTEIFKRGIAAGINGLYKKKGQKKDQRITMISMNSSNMGEGLTSI